MPAPGFRVRPIRKGVVPQLRLDGPAVGAQVSSAKRGKGALRRLPSRRRDFSAGCLLGCRLQN